MSKITRNLAKGGIATAAVGAMALAGATPAMAEHHRHRDGVDAGDVIAGALIIGGLAAILSSSNKDRYRDGYAYRGNDYRGRYGHYRGNPRRAIAKCVRAAERDARRSGYRFADVTQIRKVKRTDYGWKIKGQLAVDGNRGYAYRDRYQPRYRDGYRYDQRRYGYGYGRARGYDRGKFTCYIDRGRVSDLRYKGIRGLR